MAAEFVTITWTELDVGGGGLNGVVRFTPNTTWTIGPDSYEPAPRQFPVIDSAGQSVPLLACDSPGLSPAPPLAWYQVTVAIDGIPRRTFSSFINEANGASQTLAFLEDQQIFTTPTPPLGPYMPLAGGAYAGGVAPGGGSLADTATVTIDAAGGNDFTVTLTRSTLLATPLNPRDKQKLLIQTIQGGPGGWVLSYSAGWLFLPNPGAPSPVLGTAPGTRNYLLFRYDAGLAQWVLLAFL